MGNYYFRLNSHKQPVPVESSDEAGWERIGEYRSKKWYISTVFLGVNVNPNRETAPVIFETLVENLNDVESRELYRFQTWEEAELFHKAAVFLLCEAEDLNPEFRALRQVILNTQQPVQEWLELCYIQIGKAYKEIIEAQNNRKQDAA